MRISHDERRHAACDVFDGNVAEVNVVTLYPGSICAWHRHEYQTDYAYVAAGVVRFGRWRDSYGEEYTTSRVGDKWDCPPGIWHGYECIGNEPAIIVYGISAPYDPADEQRRVPRRSDFPHHPR